ncbi:MAG: cell division protein FtsQ/DivIB [Mycobacterium sp.]
MSSEPGDTESAPTRKPDEPAVANLPAVESSSEEADFEGPRRRARREREERRAAEERARAIEQARLLAKKRASGRVADDTATLPKGAVRGLKALAFWVLFFVIAVALGAVLYFTPVMSARQIVVTGTGSVTQEEVLAAAAVTPGTPLLQIDTDSVARRVADIRRVASARVQREYPSGLRITVVERTAIVIKDYTDGTHLFDRDGVDFATGPPPVTLPYLDVDNPGPSDPPTRAALAVLTSLKPEVAAQVGRIAAPSVASITLTLTDGRVVIWGDSERTDEKADTLAALLTQPAQTYDVSSPDLPTIK